jgi:macrolide transport system ATP-binding/permease protein
MAVSKKQSLVLSNPLKKSLIQLRDISRQFRNGTVTTALNNVSLTINQGEWISVTGPSGAGKSTLLNIVGCLDHSDGGSYLFDGLEVFHLGEIEQAWFRSENIGFIFQSFHLLPYRSVLENVMIAEIYQKISVKGRRERAMSSLEKVGLIHKIDSTPSTLSGGEKQRVAIARALMGNPKLLLCDEPTGNLDSHSTTSILELFEELNSKGFTMIVVTHDDRVSERGHRWLHIVDGNLHEGKSPVRYED